MHSDEPVAQRCRCRLCWRGLYQHSVVEQGQEDSTESVQWQERLQQEELQGEGQKRLAQEGEEAQEEGLVRLVQEVQRVLAQQGQEQV